MPSTAWPLQQVAADRTIAELAARNRRPDGRTPISPVPGVRPGFPFGAHPSNPDIRYANAQNRHTGVDFPGRRGAPIEALEEGVVVRADWGGAYGHWTHIRGARSGRVWVYCHQLDRTVRLGDRVKLGQVIGWVGDSTSTYLSGPHLHLELSRGSSWAYNDVVDPIGKW